MKVVKKLLPLIIFIFILPTVLDVHATVTSAKDTITNSRLSFRAQVVSGSSGTTTVTIGAGQSDSDTQNIFQQDNVCFANSSLNGCEGNTSYTVAAVQTYNGTIFSLSSVLVGPLTSSDIAVSTQSATHTVIFTTAVTVNNPVIKIHIPAATTTATSNDGFPDFGSAISSSGFDAAGMTGSDITCSGGGASWVASFTNSQGSGGNYHQVTCTGTGTVNSGQQLTITIGGTHKLINPAPITSGHVRGAADIYVLSIYEYDVTGTNLVDTGSVVVAPVEGVMVSTTVQNALTFSVAKIDAGQNICGKNTSIGTTATTVPFGQITTGGFYNAAQLLTVSTNSTSGYAVTVQSNGALSIDGLGVTTLPDTVCNNSPACTTTSNQDWTNYSNSGFGYSLSGADAAFSYNSAGTFQARPFDSSAPRIIMSHGSGVNGSNVYVCYQIDASGTQQSGYYMNKLTYIATATF